MNRLREKSLKVYKKRMGALVLALALLMSATAVPAGTAEGASGLFPVTAVQAAEVPEKRDLDQKNRELAYLESQGIILVEDNEAMMKDLIRRMRNHEEKMTYYYDEAGADYQDMVDSFLNGSRDEQDKIYGELGGIIRKYDEYVAGNAYVRGLGYATWGDYYCVTFTFGYYTTKAQDKKVDAIAKKLAKKYKKKTTYEKIRLTHDYLKKNITYTDGYDGAYNALVKGKSVCNGYSLAFLRIMQEMKIPCKYVTGTGNGGAHAWNLVKIGKNWYNIDVTWDDTAGTNAYFLKSDKDFKDHVRDNKKQYKGLKIASKSYGK